MIVIDKRINRFRVKLEYIEGGFVVSPNINRKEH